MDISGEFTTTVSDVDGDEHEVTVRYKGYYQQEKISGPPENCCLGEGEIDIEVDYPVGIKFPDLEEHLHDEAWGDYLNG